MLSFYVDPAVIDPEGLFPADVARYVAYFKSAKPITPGGEVLTPGEPENAHAPASAWPRACRCPTTPGPPSSPPRARSASTSAASSRRAPHERGGRHNDVAVIPVLVTGIHRAAGSGAKGRVDTGDKPRYDTRFGSYRTSLAF